MPESLKELNVHPRFQHIIDILNSPQLQGFHEYAVIAPVLSAAMREIAALDQDILAAEEAAKEQPLEAKKKPDAEQDQTEA